MSKATKDYLNNKYGTQYGYGGLHNPSKYYGSKNYIIISNYDSTYGFNVNINGKELSIKKCLQWKRKYWNHNDYEHETESYFKYLRHYYGKKYNLIIYIENESIFIVQDKERDIYEN